MTFLDDIQSEQKKYGSGQGDYFKFEKSGIYKIRILNKPKVLATHFFGKGNPAVVCVGIDEGCTFHGEGADRPSIKLATYVLNRADGKVTMAELPLSISYALNDLQQDADFAFEDFPMPYDIKVTYDPDNADPKAKYRVVASPKQEPLTKEEEALLKEKMDRQTPEAYVEAKKKKVGVSQRKSEDTYPTDNINPEDVPF